MIQRQPSFYTYFNIALCHSAVNAIFKGLNPKRRRRFFLSNASGSGGFESAANQKSDKKNGKQLDLLVLTLVQQV